LIITEPIATEDERDCSHPTRFKAKKIGFLGPSGTFTEEAASKLKGELVPFESIVDVLDAVDRGKVDWGVVPIENSIEGPVGMTLDLMAHEYDLKIRNEITLPVSHNLLVNHGADTDSITTVYSHIQALSQCRKFLDDLKVVVHATPSTSAAAELVQGRIDTAAVGTTRAASIYGLKVAAMDIQDYENNVTRFVVLDQVDHPRTGKDKTSIVLFLKEDKPGGLYGILGEFAMKDVNLTKIESRPSKEKLGSYIFFIDFEGHRDDPVIKNIINIIKIKVDYIKILGSYPTEGADLHSYG
jgi:prephenate dehydratase